jgi:hypothetical protein
MGRRLSQVALFLALTGTAVAAPLVTGAVIKDETVTGRDVKRGSLARRHLAAGVRLPRGPRGGPGPPGPQGPTGPEGSEFMSARVRYLRVSADGTSEHGAPAVPHPAPGVYCLTTRVGGWVDVVSTSLDQAQRATVVAYGAGRPAETPCADGTTARVTIDAPGTAGLDDGPFVFVTKDDDAG